jgi:hypothetical protein
MIQIAENLFIKIEQRYKKEMKEDIMIFSCENENTSSKRYKNSFYKILSYSKLFFMVFYYSSS